MANKHTLALLCVVVLALASFAAADPRPLNLVKSVNPTLACLKNAGVSGAALEYLKDCGQTRQYGKTAMFRCTGATYAPPDVKQMLKNSAHCFTK